MGWLCDAYSAIRRDFYLFVMQCMPKYHQSEKTSLPSASQALAVSNSASLLASAAAKRPPAQLGFCLDISSSMVPLVSSVVAGYNAILASLPQSQVTRVMFGSQISIPVRNSLADALSPMTEGEYELYGSTRLLDGIGAIISAIGSVSDPLPRLSKPAVLIAILTDGMENQSHQYSLEDIRQMVAYRRITCNWQFVFLSSADTSYALRLGIQPSNIVSFDSPADLAALLERLKTAANAFYLGDRNFARYLLKGRN